VATKFASRLQRGSHETRRRGGEEKNESPRGGAEEHKNVRKRKKKRDGEREREKEKAKERERGACASETSLFRMIEQGAMLGRRCTNSVGRRGPHQPRSPG